MAISAFCPAYATGVFTIGAGDSAGAGITLDIGVTTDVEKANGGMGRIRINGSETSAPVSKAVVRRFIERGCKPGLLDISHETDLPIGFGLGMSAGGALSLSLALNEFLGAGLARAECVKIAHDADVECGTGLSGVDAADIGGFLARRRVGDAPVGIEIEDRKVYLAFFKPIKTAEVIRSEEWKKKVNQEGERTLDMLFKEKSYDAFIAASRDFSSKTLLSLWCSPHMRHNPRAFMAMLGHTLVSDAPYLHLGTPMKLVEAKTSKEGAKLL